LKVKRKSGHVFSSLSRVPGHWPGSTDLPTSTAPTTRAREVNSPDPVGIFDRLLKIKAIRERSWKESGLAEGVRAGWPWGNHARKKYGKYKICDERFYSYWVSGLVELIFPDWF
jgi:hypothetical protein